MRDLVSVRRKSENWPALALLTDPNGAAYTQSGITAVTVAAYDESADPITDLWVDAQPAVSATFYNTLQTDSGWDLPSGFNFKHIVQPSNLKTAINAGHTFRVLYVLQTVLHGQREFAHYVVVKA